VTLTYPPIPQLVLSGSGNNSIFSWLVLFTNFVVQQTTNLNNSALWSTLPTNSIIRGPTNILLSVPLGLPKAFYRLKSR